MDRRWGIANIVNKTTRDKFTIKSTDLDNRIKGYFESLENGDHFNKYLQHDFNKYGMENFAVEIIADDCTSKEELNRIGNLEIRKNGLKSYNQRTANDSFSGGNLNPPNYGRRHDELLKYLSQYIDVYNLRHSSKKELELKIENEDILSKEDLLNELREISQKDKLLNLIKFSNLNPKDKELLIKMVQNKQITNERDLNNQIEIKKDLYKKANAKKSTTTSNKSSRNKKPKKHTWEEYNKTHNIKSENIFQDKVKSNSIKLERQPAPLADKCPVCSNRISKKDIYCGACGHKLKDNIHSSRNTNSLIAKVFMIEDNVGNLRYSFSKIVAFIILMLFFSISFFILLFGIPSTKLMYAQITLFGGLFYYCLVRVIGIIFRKISQFRR